MKLSSLLTLSLATVLLGSSFPASAGFNFGSPFDMLDNNDDYRNYDRGGRGYSNNDRGGRGYNNNDRWQGYDEWDPNYWRYRYFDNDSRDYIFDDFGNNGFGDGRGRFNFGMDFDMDSRYDGDYRNDFRNNFRNNYSNDFPGNGRSQDYQRNSDERYDLYDNRSAPRYDSRQQYNNDDQYNDDYWREYSRRSGNGGRRAPSYPERRR